MKFAEKCNGLFDATVNLYHQTDDVDAKVANPYEDGTIEAKLFVKNWIDTVQWHLEEIDTYFREKFADVKVCADATINTESPAWAIDRLSILALKIYHMHEQASRTDADEAHLQRCRAKLDVLLEQRTDLTAAIDQLLDDIAAGKKYMKVYRQMKLYNDPATNPVLYGKK